MSKNNTLRQDKEPKSPREKNRILAIIMIVCGVIYIPYTLMHPEMDLPYSKDFLYTTYILYIVVTVILCFMGFWPQKKKVVHEPEKHRAKPKNHNKGKKKR